MKASDLRAMLPNRRRRGAEILAHAIVKDIEPHIFEGEQRDVLEKLYRMFHAAGIDVITDEDRANAGLPARDAYGWTDAELQAIERWRTELLSRPPQVRARYE